MSQMEFLDSQEAQKFAKNEGFPFFAHPVFDQKENVSQTAAQLDGPGLYIATVCRAWPSCIEKYFVPIPIECTS